MGINFKMILKENLEEYGKGKKHLSFLGRLYSDKTHFIFELLQNAEDAGATLIDFNLTDVSLEVSHNGRLFNEDDVRGICGIGEGKKSEDFTQIGKFGIGFKSVYAFTSAPEVHSGNDHFKIEHYVRPYEITSRTAGRNRTTLFVFPFDFEKVREKDIQRLENRLHTLSGRTLLFLSKIKKISYSLPDGTTGLYSRKTKSQQNSRIVSLYEDENATDVSEKWLVFDKPVITPDNSQDVQLQIAFLIDPDDAKKINRILESPLYVYFPTEKETRFGFLIQGPFRTTPARDNIPQDDDWNNQLIQEASDLLIKSLLNLRHSGLLNVGTLETLPIREEDKNTSSPFYPIVTAVHQALTEQALLPTDNGKFVNAESAMLARSTPLRNLFRKQLTKLFDSDVSLSWLSADITYDKTPDLRHFLIKELDIQEVDTKFACSYLTKSFLEAQSLNWLFQFYKLLEENPSLWKPKDQGYDYGMLRLRSIIRLDDGTHVNPFKKDGLPNVYLPSDNSSGHYVVHKKLVSNKIAAQFLKSLGIHEIGEKDNIKDLLSRYYTESSECPSLTAHKRHIKTFIAWFEKNKDLDIFNDTFILLEKDGKTFRTPNSFYLDKPIEDTGLSALYSDLDYNDAERYPLWREYSQIRRFVPFAKEIGVKYCIHIYQTSTDYNPHRSNLQGSKHRFMDTGIDEDYTSEEIEQMVEDQEIPLSRLVWNTMTSADRKVLLARYRPSQTHPVRTAQSRLVYVLSSTKWIPGRDGKFYAPNEIDESKLRNGFLFDDENGWLSAIGFGDQESLKEEQYKKYDQHAKELGISDPEIIDIAIQLDQNPDKLLKVRQMLKKGNELPVFPSKASTDPKRRAKRTADKHRDSTSKEYDTRNRTVRTSRPAVIPDIYLRNYYTNEDGIMVCQACHDSMPFVKRNGDYYFEAVEILSRDYLDKEMEEQFIALCPVCAAKYKEFIKHLDKPSPMQKLKDDILESTEPGVFIEFGNQQTSLKFVETHFLDIKTILKNG